MKNYLPYILKAHGRINHLMSKLNQLEDKPYGGGNPYYYCPCCRKSNVQVSIDSGKKQYLNGHDKNCLKPKLEISLRSSNADLYKNLVRFMKKGGFNQKSFLHYAFMVTNSQTYNKNQVVIDKIIKEVNEFLNENPEANCENFSFYGLRSK